MSTDIMIECRHCQRPMLPRVGFGRVAVYCGQTCKRQHETQSKRKPPLEPRPCIVCGKQYMPVQVTSKVCGTQCRKKHNANRLSAWIAERPGYYKHSNAQCYDRRRKAAGHEQPKRQPRVQWLTGSCRWCGEDIKVHPTRTSKVYCDIICRREDEAYARECKGGSA
jgi:hypothetical protein